MSYSKKKRQLQEEKEARLNKTPEKETRSVIKQSKVLRCYKRPSIKALDC